MTVIDKEDLERRALAELRASEQIKIQFELPIPVLMYLIGALQLALRHPAFPGRYARFIREFIQQLKANLAQYPAICAVIDLGFNPAFDYVPENQVRRDK